MGVLLSDDDETTEGLPWCISDFSRPGVLEADAKMIVEHYGNPQPWNPTPEMLKRDAENTAKAKAELEKMRESEREEVLT